MHQYITLLNNVRWNNLTTNNNKTSLKDGNIRNQFQAKMKYLSLSLSVCLLNTKTGLYQTKYCRAGDHFKNTLLYLDWARGRLIVFLVPFQIPTQWNLESGTRPRLQLHQHLRSDVPDNTLFYYTVKLHEKRNNWRINSCYICKPFKKFHQTVSNNPRSKFTLFIQLFSLLKYIHINWMK